MTTPCRWASSGSGNRNVPSSSGMTSGRLLMRPPGSTRSGGEGGIRTRDELPRTAFPVRRHSPLGDLSERQTIAVRHRHRLVPYRPPIWRSPERRGRAPARAHQKGGGEGGQAATPPGAGRSGGGGGGRGGVGTPGGLPPPFS